MQWWHSKLLKTDCSVRKSFKSRICNTQQWCVCVIFVESGS